MSKLKYKRRYVLAEGYPWAFGKSPHKGIALRVRVDMQIFRELHLPEELFDDGSLPKYRLVLERVKGE